MSTEETMRAVVYNDYRGADGMRVVERPVPNPGAGEVRVRVHAAGLNAADWHLYLGDPWLARASFGWRGPKTEGVIAKDLAGVVDAVGEGVSGFAVGDRVYGETWTGAASDFAVIKESELAPMPRGISFEEAAALPMGALTASQGLRQAGMEDGTLPDAPRTLVVGASGGVGHLAAQIARVMGAGRVVAVCSSRNAQMLLDLGVDRVIAYDKESVFDCGETFDLVYDTVATNPFRKMRAVMTKDGTYACAGGVGGGILLGPAWSVMSPKLVSPFFSQRGVSVAAAVSGEDLAKVTPWVEDGSVRPVIEKVYELEDFAPALLRLESKHTAGKLVLRVAAS